MGQRGEHKDTKLWMLPCSQIKWAHPPALLQQLISQQLHTYVHTSIQHPYNIRHTMPARHAAGRSRIMEQAFGRVRFVLVDTAFAPTSKSMDECLQQSDFETPDATTLAKSYDYERSSCAAATVLLGHPRHPRVEHWATRGTRA